MNATPTRRLYIRTMDDLRQHAANVQVAARAAVARFKQAFEADAHEALLGAGRHYEAVFAAQVWADFATWECDTIRPVAAEVFECLHYETDERKLRVWRDCAKRLRISTLIEGEDQ